jgi:hypothetical protein
MIRYTVYPLTGVILLTLFLLTGCVSRSAPKVNYFSLLSLEQLGNSRSAATRPEIRLGIGPLSIPDNLQRSQVVTREHGNQYDFNEYNRWVGDLESDLTAIVGNNLSLLLGVDIGYFPWMPHFEPTCRLIIDIERLDGDLNGEAVLEARWSVLGADGKAQLAGGRNVYRRPVSGSGYAGLVTAESQLVADLCKEMAKAIDQLLARR